MPELSFGEKLVIARKQLDMAPLSPARTQYLTEGGK